MGSTNQLINSHTLTHLKIHTNLIQSKTMLPVECDICSHFKHTHLTTGCDFNQPVNKLPPGKRFNQPVDKLPHHHCYFNINIQFLSSSLSLHHFSSPFSLSPQSPLSYSLFLHFLPSSPVLLYKTKQLDQEERNILLQTKNYNFCFGNCSSNCSTISSTNSPQSIFELVCNSKHWNCESITLISGFLPSTTNHCHLL
jgi:hypothetical protein